MPIDANNMTATEFAIMKERYESLRKFFYNELDVKSEELPVEYQAVKSALYDMGKIVNAAEKAQARKKTTTFLKSIEEFTGKSADEYMENSLRFIGEAAAEEDDCDNDLDNDWD